MRSENDSDWIQEGGDPGRVSVGLRIMGDDLDPESITSLLGTPPTEAAKRGERVTRRGTEIVQPTGIWLLNLPRSEEWVLEDAIRTLLASVPSDLAVWSAVATLGRIDLFCGLFLDGWNRGVDLSPDVLRSLADRQIGLGLDIYGPSGGETDV